MDQIANGPLPIPLAEAANYGRVNLVRFIRGLCSLIFVAGVLSLLGRDG